ncbi:MAG TPA: hypothetical protein ENG63_07475 [Candidatus Desulfofervidus auxilii]|uniref:Uncharacterized protein n=1 Tax=Desulfofervidus auxilii TaxID=1621989 RepID=A0A7C0U3F8_DESA2|nr:hypothetical protein [Candidatus Desulfofervidus auxilii]
MAKVGDKVYILTSPRTFRMGIADKVGKVLAKLTKNIYEVEIEGKKFNLDETEFRTYIEDDNEIDYSGAEHGGWG